jgi:transglutaminase-like putative cysteine protease
MIMAKRKAPRNKERRKQDEPEDSIALRLICGFMALICIGTACVYTRTSPILTFLYVWLAFAGSYVSFFLRRRKNILLMVLTIIGLLMVLSFFAQELASQMTRTQVDMLIPFIHVLSGLFALHTFELRTREDVELNCLIGFGLMCCTTVLGTDVAFGAVVFGYLWLLASFFYFDTASLSKDKGRFVASEPIASPRFGSYRDPAGMAAVTISLLPLLAVWMYYCMPRINTMFDFVATRMQQFTLATSNTGPPMPVRFSSNPAEAGLARALRNTWAGTHGKNGKRWRLTDNLGDADQLVADRSDKGDGGVSAPGKKDGKERGKKDGTKGAPKGKAAAPKRNVSCQSSEGPSENELVMRNKDAAKSDDRLLMEVAAPGDFFYRRIVLDKYDGAHWTTSKGGTESKCRKVNGSPTQELAGVSSLFLPKQLSTAHVVQKITIQANLGHLIPAAAIPQKIDFPSDPVLVDDNGVLKARADLKPGLTYEVTSEVPTYDIEALRKLKIEAADEQNARQKLAACLEVPTSVPEEVSLLAKDVAGDDGNWFVKADRICKYLRTTFKYSLDGDEIPQEKRDLVATFLFSPNKSGACGPFASAFAIMCRTVGIPARVIGGFAPGDLNGVNGLREIHGRHAHAWAEVYIPGPGWVPFDATPGGTMPAPLEQDNSALAQLTRNLTEFQASLNPPRANMTASGAGSKAAGASTSTSQNSNQTATKTKTAGAQAGSNRTNKTPLQEQSKRQTPWDRQDLSEMSKSALGWLLRGLLVLGLIPLTLLVAQAIREGYLQFKARTAARFEKQSTLLYLRVVDDLKRYKIDRLPSETAADISYRFQIAVESGTTVHPELPGALKEFMQIYTDDRFGSEEGSVEREKQLELLSGQIRSLVRTRVYDK